MKAKDVLKPRDPNYKAMQDIRKSGASGSHQDKTKVIPRKQKYKDRDMSEAPSYGAGPSSGIGKAIAGVGAVAKDVGKSAAAGAAKAVKGMKPDRMQKPQWNDQAKAWFKGNSKLDAPKGKDFVAKDGSTYQWMGMQWVATDGPKKGQTADKATSAELSAPFWKSTKPKGQGAIGSFMRGFANAGDDIAQGKGLTGMLKKGVDRATGYGDPDALKWADNKIKDKYADSRQAMRDREARKFKQPGMASGIGKAIGNMAGKMQANYRKAGADPRKTK